MTTLRATLSPVDSAVPGAVYRIPKDSCGWCSSAARRMASMAGRRLSGGRREPSDATLLDTALREAEEGLACHGTVLVTGVARDRNGRHGLRVAPFLGQLPARRRPQRRQGEEIDEILEVRVDLLRPETHDVEDWQLPVVFTAPDPVLSTRAVQLWGAVQDRRAVAAKARRGRMVDLAS
jgi:hypothetical protein